MLLNEYQVLASRTSNPNSEVEKAMLIAALGLNGEAGEVGDTVKKIFGHGHMFDKGAVAEELGDVLWYIAEMAGLCGYTLEQVASMNVKKLLKRYPDGFSSAASIGRKNTEK